MTDSSGKMSNNWFQALGEPVPYERRAKAAEQAREMGLELSGSEEMEYIGPIAEAIEDDRPNEAIARARERLDLSGSYRLLAYLCVGVDEDDEEATLPREGRLHLHDDSADAVQCEPDWNDVERGSELEDALRGFLYEVTLEVRVTEDHDVEVLTVNGNEVKRESEMVVAYTADNDGEAGPVWCEECVGEVNRATVPMTADKIADDVQFECIKCGTRLPGETQHD